MTDYVLEVEPRTFLFSFGGVGISQKILAVEKRPLQFHFYPVALKALRSIPVAQGAFAVTANAISFQQSYRLKISPTSFFLLPAAPP